MSGAKTTPPDLQKALQTPIWPIWRVSSVESFASMPDPPVRATASAEALHLKEKAQHAGYKALVEKWDTDSDSSDGSDDELDLAV